MLTNIPVGAGAVGIGPGPTSQRQLIGVGRSRVGPGASRKQVVAPGGPSFVQAAHTKVNSAPGTITPSSAPTNGNLAFIVVTQGANNGTVPIPPTGWTSILAAEGICCCGTTQGAAFIWYKVISGSPASFTVTNLTGPAYLAYFEFSGTTHTPVAGDVIVNQNVSVGGPVSGTVYTSSATASGRLFFSFFSGVGGPMTLVTAYTNTSGVTNVINDLGSTSATAYSYDDTGTISASPMTAKWTGAAVLANGLVVQVY